MSIKMPSEEDKKQKSARHETFLKPFTECELHLDKIILNCKSIQRSVQTFFIPFYAVIVHTCVVILSSPHTHSLAQLLLLLCSVVSNKLHKIFLNTSLYSTTTTTTRRRRRRDIFVWGISEWKLENSTRLTRDFCRFSNGNLLSLRKSYCALMLQCRAHT